MDSLAEVVQEMHDLPQVGPTEITRMRGTSYHLALVELESHVLLGL